MPARSALGLLALAAAYLGGGGAIVAGEAAAGAVLVLAALVAHVTTLLVLTRRPPPPRVPSKPRLRAWVGHAGSRRSSSLHPAPPSEAGNPPGSPQELEPASDKPSKGTLAGWSTG
jgi:hypothetical protein